MKVEFEQDEQAKKDEATLTITMRGDVAAITKALVHGFPRETLQQLADAFGAELEKRQAGQA